MTVTIGKSLCAARNRAGTSQSECSSSGCSSFKATNAIIGTPFMSLYPNDLQRYQPQTIACGFGAYISDMWILKTYIGTVGLGY